MAEKKKPIDMTTDEAMEHLFPREVVERLKEEAHGQEQPTKQRGKKPIPRPVPTHNRNGNST